MKLCQWTVPYITWLTWSWADLYLFLATGVHTKYYHIELQCAQVNKKEGCAEIIRWNSLHYLMPVPPNQKELSQITGQWKATHLQDILRRVEMKDTARQNVPTKTSFLFGGAGCEEWCMTKSLLLPLPTFRKAPGCCWQGRLVSIWDDSYCYRKRENDLPSHQRLLPYLSSPTAGVASPRKALSTRWYQVSQDPLTFMSSAQWEASEHKLIDSSSFSETFMLIQYRLLMEFPFSEKISASIENSTQSCSFSFQNFRSSLKNSPKP